MEYLTVGVPQVEELEIEEPEITGVSNFTYLGYVLNRTNINLEDECNIISKGQAETGIEKSALRDRNIAIKNKRIYSSVTDAVTTSDGAYVLTILAKVVF
jgi:hypothetical protein